jgi:carbon dioxide concentrating mechanism protein CcmO
MSDTERSVGLVEVLGLPHAVVVADAMVKAADVQLIQMEVNTLGAMVIKVIGATGAVRSSFDVGEALAEKLDARVSATLIPRFADSGWVPWIDTPQHVHKMLRSRSSLIPLDTPVDSNALGFIESIGYTGSVIAVDTMCKAAAVRLAAIERIGAQRVCILVRGDVAAVEAAVQVGSEEVGRLVTVTTSLVIARPDPVIQRLFTS